MQPIITISGIVTEQSQQTVSITNTVQPVIDINAIIDESVVAQVLIKNTVMPTITLQTSVTQVEGELEYYLDELSPPQTFDEITQDYGYIDTFASGNPQTTIEADIGAIETFTVGDVIALDKQYFQQQGQTASNVFTLTVSSGDGTNYSAILSAMQTQESTYYNDVTTDSVASEVNFRVDDGSAFTYYRILLVANRINYYEIKTRII